VASVHNRLALIRANAMCASLNSFTIVAAMSRNVAGSTIVGFTG
jgi:hypothetical protein